MYSKEVIDLIWSLTELYPIIVKNVVYNVYVIQLKASDEPLKGAKLFNAHPRLIYK